MIDGIAYVYRKIGGTMVFQEERHRLVERIHGSELRGSSDGIVELLLVE